jgi:ABC-2 type transport system ATP-binding protein
MVLETIVKVDNIKKNYGNIEALKGISFEIKRGEILGIVGPNGAGKSTFFSILATISTAQSGDIIVDGKSITKSKQHIKKNIGYVPQELALYSSLSGRDNLNFWAGIYGLSGKEKKLAVENAILDMNLENVIKRKVDTYSGGMKRRLNIAIGLLHNPLLIIMDEPLVGVDIISKRKIMDKMLKLKSEGRAIVFSSHSTDEVEKLCDRIVLLENGLVKAYGRLDDILKEYKNHSKLFLSMNISFKAFKVSPWGVKSDTLSNVFDKRDISTKQLPAKLVSNTKTGVKALSWVDVLNIDAKNIVIDEVVTINMNSAINILISLNTMVPKIAVINTKIAA